jgi:hypothetical protein
MPVATFRNPTPSSVVDKPTVFRSEEHDPFRSVPSSELQLDAQQSMPNKRALLFNGLLGSPRVLVTQVCLHCPRRERQHKVHVMRRMRLSPFALSPPTIPQIGCLMLLIPLLMVVAAVPAGGSNL